MTDKEVQNGFNDAWINFWGKYKDVPPKDDASGAWEEFYMESASMKKKYPLLEEVINRMSAEIIERARGNGNVPGDYHRPPTSSKTQTDSDRDNEDDDIKKSIDKLMKVMDSIETAEQKGEKIATCTCGGVVHFGRASINNHLHARCEKCGFVIMQ